jgi:hypothetical protein
MGFKVLDLFAHMIIVHKQYVNTSYHVTQTFQ